MAETLSIAEAAARAQQAASQLPLHDAETVKLFVGQLPKTYSEELLRPIFEPFGTVVEFSIIRDKVTGVHRGCAFLTYGSKSSADAAIAALHNSHTFKEMAHPLQIKYADGELDKLEHKLFVGMINKSATEDELRAVFEPFGAVREVFILHDSNGQSKGCGFIRYEKRAQALAAISALHGVHYMQVSCICLQVSSFSLSLSLSLEQNIKLAEMSNCSFPI
jgi:CUG-BP- and ETR3-like factor